MSSLYQPSRHPAPGHLCGRIVALLFALILPASMLLLVACVPIGAEHEPTPKPPEVVAPPAYPGAATVSKASQGDIAHPGASGNDTITITLTTQDSPDQVLDYYADVLGRAGWQDVTESCYHPDGVCFKYGHGPIYKFNVRARRDDSITKVVIEIKAEILVGRERFPGEARSSISFRNRTSLEGT